MEILMGNDTILVKTQWKSCKARPLSKSKRHGNLDGQRYYFSQNAMEILLGKNTILG
jgi:hypothetical protein